MDSGNIKESTVSIVIPVHNVEQYLDACLESVVNQTYRALDIILVEDGSVDSSLEKCEIWKLRDHRIRVAEIPQCGLGMARNHGIGMAKGEWICFVDGDDAVHPEFVDALLQMVLEYGCLVAHCAFAKFEDDILESARTKTGNGSVKSMDFEQFFFCTFNRGDKGHSQYAVWSNIYHRSLFDKVMFENLHFAEDSDFTPKIMYAAREIAVTDQRLYFYRQREDSLLHQKCNMNRLDRYSAKKATMDMWMEKGLEEMVQLFYPDFIRCMILDYIDLSANFPEEKGKYAFLKTEILECLNDSGCFSPDIMLYPNSGKLWKKLQTEAECGAVICGFGFQGKEIFRGLNLTGLKVLEVWDQKFEKDKVRDNTRYTRPHRGLPAGTPVLVSIENRCTSLEAERKLRELGYRNFWLLNPLHNAVKYRTYEIYFPELIRYYSRLQADT